MARRAMIALLAAAASPCLAFLAAPGSQAPPELVLVNGKIITVDARFSVAQAVAIRNGTFVAVGSTAAVRALAGPTTRIIDLKGRTVVAGLSDDHLHSAGGGPGVDLSRARSLEELLAAIAARAAETPPGGLIVTNSDWHEGQLREHRLPLRRDLDRVAPRHPVVVVRGGHEYILNSAALAKWGISEQTPDPPGGRLSRYPDGTLNGELVDTAKNLVTLPPPPARSLEERIRDRAAEYARLNAAGLTSIRHAGVSGEEYRLLEEMRRRGLLTLRVSVLVRPDSTASAEEVLDRLGRWAIHPDEGDRWLRVVGVKLSVDGGFEGAFLREPYAEPWGQGGSYRGLVTLPADRYTAIVRGLNRAGWRVATHAVGDAAIDQVLAAYEAADAERSIAGRRWSIEHAFLAHRDQIRRMKRLGLVVSAQHHLYLAGPSLVQYWGRSRAARITPMRDFFDAGLVVAAGSDAPVVPYPPLGVLYHFVTRATLSGGVLGADQRISREHALRASTINNAYLTFEEHLKGSIEPGKVADLVVLSEDVLTCPAPRLEQTTVLMTMVEGRIVFEHPSFRQAGADRAR